MNERKIIIISIKLHRHYLYMLHAYVAQEIIFILFNKLQNNNINIISTSSGEK